MSLNNINLADYTYKLPEERIANFPLEKRDESKLLVFQNEQITHHHFKDVVDFLTPNNTLFFNDTKVIPARLYFHKETGALIEIFLLNPISPVEVYLAMTVEKQCTWACAIGNLRRLKEGDSLSKMLEVGDALLTLKVTLIDYEKQIVRFEWEGVPLTFAELLVLLGQTPLPPYIRRDVEESDKENYQTVYAKNQGAVAAPTAGLHFTDEVLARLQKQGVKLDYLTLHVAGGTFQPIRHDKIEDHPMHAEQMIISKQNVENLISSNKIVAVGTTSMRTLESLYWYGVKLMTIPEATFQIKKLMPYKYQTDTLPSKKEAFQEVLNYMTRNQLDKISGETEIMIVPSYPFQVCDALITNFHLSGTTLILLVAAFIGEGWKEIYAQALANEYRFLSFGDSSLLFRKKE